MDIKSKDHPLNSIFTKIETENQQVDNLFDKITPKQILQNEDIFFNAFEYFTPNEYLIIKEFKSIKAIKIYIKKYNLNKEEQIFWLDVCIKNETRIKEFEKDNLECLFNLDTELAYEILLENDYTKKIDFDSKIKPTKLYCKKIALNDIKFLESIAEKNILPLAFKIFYGKNYNISNIKNTIQKIHKNKPSFYTYFLLDLQPTKKNLKEDIDWKLTGFLDDTNLLNFLFEQYNNNKNYLDFFKKYFNSEFIKKDNMKDEINKIRLIKNIDNFVTEKYLVPEKISSFLSNIVNYIDYDADFFNIFYKISDYQSYISFYEKILKIKHKIIIDSEKNDFFMQYPFYRTNFNLNFDPLNYEKGVDAKFLDKYFKDRPDINFYKKYLIYQENNSKNNEFKIANDEKFKLFVKKIVCSEPILRNNELPKKYFESFEKPNILLLETKLGIFYVMLNHDKIEKEVIINLMKENQKKNNILNYILDEFMWNFYDDISVILPFFKNIYDNTLQDILENKKINIDFKTYLKYRSYEKEVFKNVCLNFSLDQIIQNYLLDKVFVGKCIKEKIKENFIVNFKIVFDKMKNNENFLIEIINEVDNKHLTDLFSFLRNYKDSEILFQFIKIYTEFEEMYVDLFKKNCTIIDAKRILEIKNQKINTKVNFNCSDNTKDILKKSKNEDSDACKIFNYVTNSDPVLLVKNFEDFINLLSIYDFYPPFIYFHFDLFLEKIKENQKNLINYKNEINRIFDVIFNDFALLFTVKDKIKKYLQKPNILFLQKMNNKTGFFTEELFLLTKTISFSNEAFVILKTTDTFDFIKLPNKEMINTILNSTFEYFIDERTEKILFYRLKEILIELKKDKSDLDFGKKVLKIVSNVSNITPNYDFLFLTDFLLLLLSDDRFLDEIIDILTKWINFERNIIFKFEDILGNDLRIAKVYTACLLEIEKDDEDFVEENCLKMLGLCDLIKNKQTNDLNKNNLVNDLNKKYIDNDNLNKKYIDNDNLIKNKQKNNIDKPNSNKQKNTMDDISNGTLNFLAYAPSLKCYKRHKENFVPILKNIYLSPKYEIAIKAFIKIYDKNIENFIVKAIFENEKGYEALRIFDELLKLNKKLPNTIFATIYILRFENTEKIKRKAFELWISNFKMGMIKEIINDLILLCFYNKKNENLFEYCLNEILDKYSEILEEKLNLIIDEIKEFYIESENNYTDFENENLEFTDNFEIKNQESDLAKNKFTTLNYLKKNTFFIEKLSFQDFVKISIKCINKVLIKALKNNKLHKISFEFIKIHTDETIIMHLINHKKYKNEIIDLIIQNKVEFSFLLENSRFIDEMYLRLKDTKLIPFTSDRFKMTLMKENERHEGLFANINVSKEWESFLPSVDPFYSIEYLKKEVVDFGGLKMLFERVFYLCEEVDDLIMLFYVDYLKDVSFKYVKDFKKLFNVFLKGKVYNRTKELIKYHCDDEIIIDLLKEALNGNSYVEEALAEAKSNDLVLNDYLKIFN
ncbi:hypothetical protein GVAV_003492 [Gurleya vavrai]